MAALASAAALLATSPGLPMVWDEGNAILRAEALLQGDWRYAIEHEGHPAFYGVVIAAGQWFAGGWLPPLTAARFGPMMLFSLAAGAIFYRMGREYGTAAALGAVAALLLMPRVFAHAHFASFDGPLTACWILAWAAFAPATKRSSAAVLWGVLLGMTMSCKATGWIAPVPFAAIAVAYRDRAALRALAVGIPVALATFFVLNPPLWSDPVGNWLRFFDLNLHRTLDIPVQFFGQRHDFNNPLPWYNTVVWTAITVPVGTLLLAGLGVVAVFRQRRTHTAGMLLLANWLVLLVVRAMPGTPPHDGIRLFLPSFAFLAALAGVGCPVMLRCVSRRGWLGRIVGCVSTHHGPREPETPERETPKPGAALRSATGHPTASHPTLAVVLLVLLYASSASSLLWYAPQWLSYYNLLIGGLPGATAAGMEPTYYWDGLDRSTLAWLDENTADDETVVFQSALLENLSLMQRWQTLRCTTAYWGPIPDHASGFCWWLPRDPTDRTVLLTDAPPKPRWYVTQNRPGAWPDFHVDQWLILHGRPEFVKTIRAGGIGPWRLDVPVVAIYDYREYEHFLPAARAVYGMEAVP